MINFKIPDVKRKSVLHNGGCVEKETNYHLNCVTRLGTFRLVRADNVFFRFFFHIVGIGNGMIDLWDPSTRTALWKNSSVKWSKCLSGWNSQCVWERTLTLFPLQVRSQGFRRWSEIRLGFIVVALYNTSTTCHNCCSKEDFKAVQQTVGKKSFLGDSLISRGK